MHQLLEKLSKDHRNLERVLDLLSLQLDHFFAGEESNFDLKIELLEYIEAYAEQGHHPLEDLIYATALPRVSEQVELIQRLRDQHVHLTRLTRTFRRSLEGVLQDEVISRDELETQGRQYIALQREHLKLEEQEVFPLLDQVMTEADWRNVYQHMPKHEDPVFESPDKIRFQTLYEYLESEL